MPNEPLRSDLYPFRVFISHKISGHGLVAEKIKRKLEDYAKDKLHIFVSPALAPGVTWRKKVLKEIENADLFILLYLVEGIDMDWCLYEAGYFEREARKTGQKLICVINPQRSPPGPLENRQRLEATSSGVEDLLRAIYADKDKPVREDLFYRESSDTLNQLRDFVLEALQPVKQQALSPRLWITLSGKKHIEEIIEGTLPGDVQLGGEAEALKLLGMGPHDKITVEEFRHRSDFKLALQYLIPHVANCMRRIIQNYPDLWIIPPVRLVGAGQPKVLVPAYVEKGLGDKYRFEFLVYQPEPDFHPNAQSTFGLVCNLFFLASSFRRLIIDEWLEIFECLQSLGPTADLSDIAYKMRKFRLVFETIKLRALNRNLDSPRRIEKCFGKEDQEVLRLIMNQNDGLYMSCEKRLYSAIENNDLDGIAECLGQLKNINKTLLVISAKHMHELAMKKDGELVSVASRDVAPTPRETATLES